MLAEPVAQKRRPQTLIDAKFSLPFTVATALAHEEVTLASFTPQTMADTTLLALAGRCDFELRAGWGRDRAAAGELTLCLRDGREFRASVPQALGHPTRPLPDERLRAKFMDCASHAQSPLAGADIARLADTLLRFESVDDAGSALRCEPA